MQVIEGRDMRLVYSGPHASKGDPVLIAMRGGKLDHNSISEKIVELNETEEIVHTPDVDRWDQWDM